MLFNRNKYSHHREQATDFRLASYAGNDILERLGMINKQFTDILVIGVSDVTLPYELGKKYPNAHLIITDITTQRICDLNIDFKICIDEEILHFANNSFDLIIYSLGMHAINDVQKFLGNINNWLKAEGIFIANFIGGNSLQGLRRAILLAEEKCGLGYKQHILPFIRFDHLAPLIKQAGFQEIITDYEIINLQYVNPLELIYDIKRHGESNIALKQNYNLTRKSLKILQENINFTDQLELLTATAAKQKGSIICI